MSSHDERHRSDVGGWLHAAVLGANDGVVSTASLVLGVAAAEASTGAIVTAGMAGLVGGALWRRRLGGPERTERPRIRKGPLGFVVWGISPVL